LKEEEVINLSSKCNFNATKAIPLKLEASGREYWRVLDNKDSLVLCYLNPSLGDHLDFLKISNLLNANNISTADVIHHNADIGVTLQKDLGDDDLLTIFNEENKQDLLKRSLDLLAKIQGLSQEEIPKLTHDELVDQMHLFKDIFCINFLEVEPDNSIDDLMLLTTENIKQQPLVNCHFDFERRNLILYQNQITVIDHQDMKIGPLGIDLSGILIDHYYPVNLKDINMMLAYFSKQIKSKYNSEELFNFLRWGSIQRNMRILGTLANLFIEHKRSFRLKDLPMILSNLECMIPDNHKSKLFISEQLQPLLNKKLLDI
jgi:aminoglycoside/choline kinase family phosphotransferase|tara:strand:+ start:141 stop:1091 length:951 start_codon:yes stop_codon:yes gene_type:complete